MTPSCESLLSDYRQSLQVAQEFGRQREALQKEFKEYSVADIDAQAEGVLDRIYRNAAIKVHGSLKKLETEIASYLAQAAELKRAYCERCVDGQLVAGKDPGTECSLCPAAARCLPSH